MKTPTPEERAVEAIGERFIGEPEVHNQLVPDIAAALREAEAAACSLARA